MTTGRLAAAFLLLLAVAKVEPVRAGENYYVSGSLGSLYYEYAFDVPPARGRYQPRLLLRYGGKQGDFNANGATWGIPPIPLIRYDSVNPPLDGQMVYRYVDHENPDRILLASPRDSGTVTHYAREVEDGGYMDFWPLDANASAWCARDATGNTYRFEQWASGGGWGLTQVVDPDGNVTKYNYRWPMYPASIQYNNYGVQPAPPADCSLITGLSFATELAIDYQGTSSSSGYVQNVRINNACPVSATCPSGQITVRRYGFTYKSITWTWYQSTYPFQTTQTMSVLGSVTEFGGENGGARPPMSFDYQQLGNDQDPLVMQAHLAKVTTPLGAQRVITWIDSTQFGDSSQHSYPVVRNIAITGPGLAPQSIDYGYAGIMPPETKYFVQSYYPPGEFRGFSQSWETDWSTGIVKHAWWETASHAFVGTDARIEHGARVTADSFPTFTSYTPPTSSVFQTEVFENVARSISGPGTSGNCTLTQAATGKPGNFATEVPQSSYPVIGFRQKLQQTRQVDAVQLSSQRTVACADVDTWGNPGKIAVDPDINTSGDEYLATATFEVGFNYGATCKSCARERATTDPAGTRLAATYYTYTATFQLYGAYRQVAPVASPANSLGTSAYPRVTITAFNPDGTLGVRREGNLITSYTYDSYRIRPIQMLTYDASIANLLTTTTLYDDFGRPYSVTGPAVQRFSDGAPLSPIPVKYYAYDALGRMKIVSQQPMSGSQVQAAVQAFEYAEYSGGTPASIRTYDFVVPTNYSDPGVPLTSDARQTVSWVDGLGREIQVRQRMGGTGSGDPAAGIMQNLSQYRVLKAVRYDGGGRVTATLEPYFSASISYLDLTNASSLDASVSPVRVALVSYDSQGRVVCNITRVASTTVPALGSCVSSFAEDANYALATVTSYRGVAAGTSLLAVKTIPPENNYSGGPAVGPESFFDSAGLLRWTTDAEGNTTINTYDLIGRPRKTSRQMVTSDHAGSLSPSTRPTTIDTTFTLDLMGRTVQRTDPNIGRRTFVFDDTVISNLPVKMQFDKTGDEIRYTYDKGRPQSVTTCTNSGGTLSCTVDSTLWYDLPYQGSTTSYPYTAGRLAYATNANATIAFGYDPNGSVTRRDEWIQGISGGFGSLETPRLDGQSVASGLTTPFASSSYGIGYDSAGRPTQLFNGGSTYWAATGLTNPPPTGYYDALGQILYASYDGGLVTQSLGYGPSSSLLSSEAVQFGSAGASIYNVGNMTYRGKKLTGFTDALSSTTYGYWYSNVGRLVSAKATPSGTSALSQNTLVCVTYNATKEYGAGPSLGNIERAWERGSASYTSNFAYTGSNAEGTSPAPHLGGPDAPTSVGTSGLGYDDYGRIVSAAGGAETFGYDLLGRMTSITRQSGTSEKLYYDPLGALVQRLVGTTAITYVGRRATVIGTLAQGCTVPACGVVVSSLDVHTTQGSRRVASARVYPTNSPRTLYYYRDRLGSVVATTLGAGLSGASYRYSAYGVLEVASGESSDSASEIGFTGALKLSGGLLAMGARVYNPALKIWMQPDPLQPFKYDYADGDPIDKLDPSGTTTIQVGISMNGTLGFLAGTLSFGIAFDGKNVGLYYTYGAGAGVGAGATAGATLQFSDAKTIFDLEGPFQAMSVGGGWGPDATADAFMGKGSDGAPVLGGGLTGGAGAGATSFMGATNTHIIASASLTNDSRYVTPDPGGATMAATIDTNHIRQVVIANGRITIIFDDDSTFDIIAEGPVMSVPADAPDQLSP